MTSMSQRAVVSAWGLFAALLLLMLGRGLTGVLVGVRSEFEGFSTTTTGVIMASYFVGFLAGSQVTPRLMARVGHIRVFAGLASLVAVASLAYALWVGPIPWILFRLVFGFSIAGLFVVAESWLNERATNANRGRVMAVYMVVSMGGMALGQAMSGAGDPTESTLFMVAGALVALSVVPVSLSIGTAPAFQLPPKLKPREVWNAAPLGIVVALFGGVANAALLGMAGVYAIQVGLSTERTAVFVAAGSIGAMLLQWPIGYLSDLIGRRPTILIFSGAAAVVGVVAISLDPGSVAAIGAMFLFGGFSFSMYSLSLSHVIDVLPPGRAVTASVAIVFVTGVGAIIGPIAASLAMDGLGPDGLWWTVAVAHAAIGLYALIRLARRPKIEGLTEEPYLAVPARSPGIVRLVQRNGRKGRSKS